MSRYKLIHGDCVSIMNSMDEQCVDLVLGSPPYEDIRDYGIGFDKSGDEWVSWMVQVCEAAERITRGLAIFVIGSGKVTNFRWSVTPALLLAELHRRGFHLRRPLIYYRIGIPGSGGKDYLRNNYEWIIVIQNRKKPGAIPFANPLACARKTKHPWKHGRLCRDRNKDGTLRYKYMKQYGEKANPGDVIRQNLTIEDFEDYIAENDVIHCSVGCGRMGPRLIHSNEAVYPVDLAKFITLTFSPENGIVLDPFSGSGTTVHAALECNRFGIGIDIRESQIELSHERLKKVTPAMF